MRPVVLVHGIWDSARRIAPLAQGLARRGITRMHVMDLSPPWGNALLEKLAEQVHEAVESALAQSDFERVDIVGFSMGALVTRTYLSLLAGHTRVRRFISISAPHKGTLLAYALPLAGVRQMRPKSAFLASLGPDASAWPDVSVHCIYTPFDSTIVPGESGVLTGARSVHRVPVLVHRWMMSDARVLDLTAALLTTTDEKLPCGFHA
jgi:triacylglycerol lipase